MEQLATRISDYINVVATKATSYGRSLFIPLLLKHTFPDHKL